MYLHLYENLGRLSFIDIFSKSNDSMLVVKGFVSFQSLIPINHFRVAFKALMSSDCLSKLSMNYFKVISVGS